jgi:hypothetical protein
MSVEFGIALIAIILASYQAWLLRQHNRLSLTPAIVTGRPEGRWMVAPGDRVNPAQRDERGSPGIADDKRHRARVPERRGNPSFNRVPRPRGLGRTVLEIPLPRVPSPPSRCALRSLGLPGLPYGALRAGHAREILINYESFYREKFRFDSRS